MALKSLKNIISIRASTSDDWLDITDMVESFSIGNEELVNEDSGRTLDGTMHNNVVTDKEYYDLTLKEITWGQMARLMSVLRGRSKLQFQYPSPFNAGQLSTNWFYCQGRTGQCKMIYQKVNGNVEIRWSSLTFRLAQI